MIIDKEINLDLTINSGQTSQPPWKLTEDVYSDIVSVDRQYSVFNVKQSGKYLDFNSNTLNDKAILKLNHIFDLDFNLDKFYKYLSGCDELNDMVSFCRGLRLFKAKDPFECVISSICSANNSIKRWTKSISDIKENWGLKYDDFYSFPDCSVLANVYLDDEEETLKEGLCKNNNLKYCGVGYRSPYIRDASQIFLCDERMGDISSMKYDEAFDTILEISGVGPKVADCILLYGYGFNEAFPCDVWIKRIVSYLYFDGDDISVGKVRNFGMEEFGRYAGYVQLYMFHYARKSGLMSKLK